MLRCAGGRGGAEQEGPAEAREAAYMAPAKQPREESLVEALSRVPDARSRHGRLYQLGKVLALGVCAMAQWGREHCALVCEALGIERGETPCVAALHRVFRRLDVAAF